MEGGVVPKSDDGSVKPGSPFHQWGEVSLQSGDAFGKSLRIVDDSKHFMIDAGFVDVVEHRYKLPVGGAFQSSSARYKGNIQLIFSPQAGQKIHI